MRRAIPKDINVTVPALLFVMTRPYVWYSGSCRLTAVVFMTKQCPIIIIIIIVIIIILKFVILLQSVVTSSSDRALLNKQRNDSDIVIIRYQSYGT
jgi:hypothetical protein